MKSSKSVYNLGANDGLIMGAYLAAMFLFQSIGLKHFGLLLIGNLMMIGVPVLTYILLLKGFKVWHGKCTFSAIWLHGIITFICGSLIMAIVAYIFMRYIEPTFISDQIKLVADTYRSFGTAETEQMAKTFDRIIEENLVPSPISLVFAMVWLVSFLGAVTSCILAAIIKLTHRRRQ